MGLYTIAVLAELERDCGRPLARCFDLLAGTSIGAIIALGLAAEVPAAKIKDAFERRGKEIFSKPIQVDLLTSQILEFSRTVIWPKYRSEPLRSVVDEILGEGLLIGNLRHRVVIPVVNLTKGRPQMFKTSHHERFRRDLHLRAADVAIAASAAPTYFPIAEIGDELFVDGGIYSNSPDLLALHEAEYYLGQVASQVRLLSIGTTTAKYSFGHLTGRNFGVFKWLQSQRLVNVILASQQQSIHDIVSRRLEGRYLRLDTDQSKEQERYIALDAATDTVQKTMRGLASGTIQQHINDPLLREMLTYTAPRPMFYYQTSDMLEPGAAGDN